MRDTYVDGQVWIPINEVENVNSLLQNMFHQNDESQNKENKTSAYLEDIHFDEGLRLFKKL